MMCARELNSEVATTGPCSEEAYWYGRCRAMESDVDVSIYMRVGHQNCSENLPDVSIMIY